MLWRVVRTERNRGSPDPNAGRPLSRPGKIHHKTSFATIIMVFFIFIAILVVAVAKRITAVSTFRHGPFCYQHKTACRGPSCEHERGGSRRETVVTMRERCVATRDRCRDEREVCRDEREACRDERQVSRRETGESHFAHLRAKRAASRADASASGRAFCTCTVVAVAVSGDGDGQHARGHYDLTRTSEQSAPRVQQRQRGKADCSWTPPPINWATSVTQERMSVIPDSRNSNECE